MHKWYRLVGRVLREGCSPEITVAFREYKEDQTRSALPVPSYTKKAFHFFSGDNQRRVKILYAQRSSRQGSFVGKCRLPTVPRCSLALDMLPQMVRL